MSGTDGGKEEAILLQFGNEALSKIKGTKGQIWNISILL